MFHMRGKIVEFEAHACFGNDFRHVSAIIFSLEQANHFLVVVGARGLGAGVIVPNRVSATSRSIGMVNRIFFYTSDECRIVFHAISKVDIISIPLSNRCAVSGA